MEPVSVNYRTKIQIHLGKEKDLLFVSYNVWLLK
jgi:hypothetical protein